MQLERWKQIRDLFGAAEEQPASQRAGFLNEACPDDPDLRNEVETLLKRADLADQESFLKGSPLSSIDEAHLALKTGDTLGDFQILEALGHGGMGEVYRARDTRLKREVALKVLPGSFARDPERMARFQREAEVLASLNHPNIAQIYGVEGRALVMELVEGATLNGPLPLEQALDYARQIADALDYAHEKGIIHRDLKPSNIMIAPGGIVKLLDFGLAKTAQLASGDPRTSPTATVSPTRPGMILGSPGYMSPEQARGKDVDKRADIWAFGVVLHEILTGRTLFQRDSIPETLAAVMKEEPDLNAVPPRVRRLLANCLEKDARKRLRDIADAWRLLDHEPEIPRWTQRRLWPPLAVVFSIAVCFVVIRTLRSPSNPSSQVRATMELLPAASLVGESRGHPRQRAMTFSADGNTLVFAGFRGSDARLGSQLYRRALDESEALPLAGTEGAFGPFFSPDGKWIGFWAEGSLKKIPATGGPAVSICDLSQQPWGATWGSNDTIIFADAASNRIWSQSPALMQVPARGGAPRPLIKQDPASGETFSGPEFLPDGKTLVFTIIRNPGHWEEAQVVAQRLDTGLQRVLLNGASSAHYVPTGHLLYLQKAVLMAVPFDAHRLECTGTPVPLLEGVMQAVNSRNPAYESGIGQFAVSSSGHLVYASGGIYPAVTMMLMRADRKGALTSLNLPKGVYGGLRLSPDGQRLALSRRRETSRLSDIWICDLVRGTATQLTTRGDAKFPLWSLDGKRILFTVGASENQILSTLADGQGDNEVVETGKGARFVGSWSPDGHWLAYLGSDSTNYQIWVRPLSGRGDSTRVFLNSGLGLTDPAFSPDGKWIAFGSSEAGRQGVYVQAFPGPGDRHRVSIGVGVNPAWRPDGRELFYLEMTKESAVNLIPTWKMIAVDTKLGNPLQVGAPKTLFEGVATVSAPLRNFDVYPDGQHFIIAHFDDLTDQRVARLHLVLSWLDELRRRAPANN